MIVKDFLVVLWDTQRRYNNPYDLAWTNRLDDFVREVEYELLQRMRLSPSVPTE